LLRYPVHLEMHEPLRSRAVNFRKPRGFMARATRADVLASPPGCVNGFIAHDRVWFPIWIHEDFSGQKLFSKNAVLARWGPFALLSSSGSAPISVFDRSANKKEDRDKRRGDHAGSNHSNTTVCSTRCGQRFRNGREDPPRKAGQARASAGSSIALCATERPANLSTFGAAESNA